MYRTAQQRAWDNYSIIEYAKEEGREEEKKAMVLEMLKSGIDITVIATCSKLSIEEIVAL